MGMKPRQMTEYEGQRYERVALKFLARRGEMENPPPLHDDLVELLDHVYQAGRRSAMQSVRIRAEVARDGIHELVEMAAEGEGDEHEAARALDLLAED